MDYGNELRMQQYTLYTAGCHKLSSIQIGGLAIFVLLHRLWDQLSPVFLYMGRHLLCHMSCHCTHSINCKYTELPQVKHIHVG